MTPALFVASSRPKSLPQGTPPHGWQRAQDLLETLAKALLASGLGYTSGGSRVPSRKSASRQKREMTARGAAAAL